MVRGTRRECGYQKQTKTRIPREMVAHAVGHANTSAERVLQPRTLRSNRMARNLRTGRGRWWASTGKRVGKRSDRDSSAPPVDHGHIIRRHTEKGSLSPEILLPILQNDLIPKILVQIQQTAIQSQRSLNISRQQTAAKERERRILQLTIDEISSIDKDVNMYKGVGKM